MAKQTQMIETKNIHLVEISYRMAERLKFIKIHPHHIIAINFLLHNNVLQKMYSNAVITPIKLKNNISVKSDLVFAVLLELEETIVSLLTQVKNILKSGGLLMAGLLNTDINMQDIGDLLAYEGFIDIVLDKENLDENNKIIYVHAWRPKTVSILVSQIQRF